jgi:hypothetical protein
MIGRKKNDGRGRLGGRVAGIPNKVTTDLKTWISTILDDGRDKFVESLDKLEPPEYIRTFTGLLNYALPKQAPTTPDDVLRKEKEMLQELLLSLPDEVIYRISKMIVKLEKKEENESEIE